MKRLVYQYWRHEPSGLRYAVRLKRDHVTGCVGPLTDAEYCSRFVVEYPEADPHRLRGLAEQARDEKRASKPLKRYRELFHVLNAFLQDHARRHP